MRYLNPTFNVFNQYFFSYLQTTVGCFPFTFMCLRYCCVPSGTQNESHSTKWTNEINLSCLIGVLIVLGLGTAIRLGLECCHELGTRTTVQRVDFNISPGYPAAASVAV